MDLYKINLPWFLSSPILLCVLSFSLVGCEEENNGNGSPGPEDMGNWEVTEITGEILDERHPPGEPVICEPYTYYYQPVIGEDASYIQFEKSDPQSQQTYYPDSVDRATYEGEDLDVFIFHFSFDNGYLGNDVLKGSGSTSFFESLIPGSESFSGGVWNKDGVWGEFRTENSSGGFSRFIVQGTFVTEDRIEGEWTWLQHTKWNALPSSCETWASGGGAWTAERK